MALQINMVGFAVEVHEVPPMPGAPGGGIGLFFQPTDGSSISYIYAMPEEVAKSLGPKLMGLGKIEKATALDLSKIIHGDGK